MGGETTCNNRDGAHIQRTKAGQWNKLWFDFSGENDWMGGDSPINNKRITGIFFNMHNKDFIWPPPANYTGTFIIRNLRVGSATDFVPPSVNTTHPVGNQAAFIDATNQKLRVSCISNGTGNSEKVSITIENSNPDVVINPAVSEVGSMGYATLTYNTGAEQGRSNIFLTEPSGTSADSTISFNIDVLPNKASEAAVVSLDMSQRFQKMYGLGTFSNSRRITYCTPELRRKYCGKYADI